MVCVITKVLIKHIPAVVGSNSSVVATLENGVERVRVPLDDENAN